MTELMVLKHYLALHFAAGAGAGAGAGVRARDQRGAASPETVIWIAIGAALALAAGGIVVAKVIAKANSISM